MSPNLNPQTGIPYGIISGHYIDSDLLDELIFDHGEDKSYQEAQNEFVHCFLNDPIGTYIEFYDPRPRLTDEEVTEILEDAYPLTTPSDILDFFNFGEYYDNPEPIVEGVYQDVHYRTTYIGGSVNLFIFQSPYITNTARECSPCVPNAGNLDPTPSPSPGDYTCYDVPPDWRSTL